jgi:hypothetical protein
MTIDVPIPARLAIFVANLFKSRRWLEAENVWLRHQLNVALRRSPARLQLSGIDRACWFGWLGSGLTSLARSRR